MHPMAIRQRHVRQQRMRRDNLMDWWLEAAGPYSGEVADDPRGDEIKQYLAETSTDQQDGAEDGGKALNRPWFDSYIPLDLQDSDGKSYNYQISQRAVGIGRSPNRIRRGSQTPREMVPILTDLSAQLEVAQKVFEARRDHLDSKIRESEIHGQRTTLLLTELESVKGGSQRWKEGLHMEPRLAEDLWKELSQQLEDKGLDKSETAADFFQAKITSLKKKLGYANMETALRQEMLERQDAAATILREQVAQLLEELEKQEATTASLYKQVIQLQSDIEDGKEERLQLWEQLKKAGTSTEHPSRQRSKSNPGRVHMEKLQLQEKLQRQDATNISLQTKSAPLLEELENQKATTASLYKQVAQLQLDLGDDEEERLQLSEELERVEMAMADLRAQVSELTALQSATKQALEEQQARANYIRHNVIQREEQALQREEDLKRQEELKSQDATTAGLSKQVAQPPEELQRDETTTASVGKDVPELLEELEAVEAASENLHGLVSQLETLQNAAEEALGLQEEFQNDLGQKIRQLDKLDGAAKGAARHQTEIEKQVEDRAARQRQADQLVSSLADAVYEEKTLQERVTELTAQLANTEVDGLADRLIVNMEVHPREVRYLNSRVVEVDGSSGQHVFSMDVHVL